MDATVCLLGSGNGGKDGGVIDPVVELPPPPPHAANTKVNKIEIASFTGAPVVTDSPIILL